MSEPGTVQDKLERQLETMFAALREVESKEAPPFEPGSGQVKLAEGGPKPPLKVAWGLVAAIVVAVIAFPDRQQPETLYLDIIASAELVTEDMIIAPPEFLPEQGVTPVLFGEDGLLSVSPLYN